MRGNMDDKTAPGTIPQSAIEYSKADDFATAYANNVFFESSLWDLRLIFGQNDQQISLNAVVQHTAITMPWPQVKLMTYFMETCLLAHEIQNGRIQIPPNLIPPVPAEPPKELQTPTLLAIHKAFKAHYDTFIAATPEAAPERIETVKSKK
jgi:hypothetical protein